MDYEKKYKEALERARKCWGEYNELVGAYENKGICEEIFPELKESEDERIRKMIINTLNRDKILTEDEAYDCVAWLEKQGEQRPADFSDLRTWKYIVDAVRSEIEGIGQYLDSPFTEKVAKKLQKRFCNIEQQKPEWGIEDKAMLQRAVYYINYYQTHKADTQESYECINWLNSLKDRVLLYKEVIKK